MYNYQEQKKSIFTEEGQVMFLKIRDNVHSLLRKSGAVRMQEAVSVATGDTWMMLACVDRLVELQEISEITDNYPGQHRVFVKRNDL